MIYQVCTCGQLPAVSKAVVAVPNADANTKACQLMLFYSSVPTSPNSICSSNVVTSTLQDSCTVKVRRPQTNCRRFCSSYPGLTCLDGAYTNWDSTCAVSSKGKIGCDVYVSDPVLWYSKIFPLVSLQ
jgi:hypothetical protein